jgi:hypothetical protein
MGVSNFNVGLPLLSVAVTRSGAGGGRIAALKCTNSFIQNSLSECWREFANSVMTVRGPTEGKSTRVLMSNRASGRPQRCIEDWRYSAMYFYSWHQMEVSVSFTFWPHCFRSTFDRNCMTPAPVWKQWRSLCHCRYVLHAQSPSLKICSARSLRSCIYVLHAQSPCLQICSTRSLSSCRYVLHAVSVPADMFCRHGDCACRYFLHALSVPADMFCTQSPFL